LLGLVTDKAVVEENEAKLAKVLDIYESRLAHPTYLTFECFTLADLHHLPAVRYLLGTEGKKLFDSRPHVSAWVADITARPVGRLLYGHLRSINAHEFFHQRKKTMRMSFNLSLLES